jgi:membrane protein
MAAAIAYNVLFAIIPLIALFVAGFGFLVRMPEIRTSVVDRILEAVPLTSGVVIGTLRAVSSASGPLGIAGFLGLIWTAMGLFGTVRGSVNTAWDVEKGPGLIRRTLLDLGSMIGLGLLLGASILGTTALHALQNLSGLVLGRFSYHFELILDAIGWLFPAAVTFAAFYLLYRYVPNVRHGFREVWPGALLAAVLFEVAKHGFAIYVAHFNRYEVLYGSLGAVMLFLFWVYVSSNILLIGAELAAVHEEWRRRFASP